MSFCFLGKHSFFYSYCSTCPFLALPWSCTIQNHSEKYLDCKYLCKFISLYSTHLVLYSSTPYLFFFKLFIKVVYKALHYLLFSPYSLATYIVILPLLLQSSHTGLTAAPQTCQAHPKFRDLALIFSMPGKFFPTYIHMSNCFTSFKS